MKVKLLAFFLLFSTFTFAQEYIFGKVVSESNTDIQEVLVLNLRTDEKALTDKHGNYMIAAKNVAVEYNFTFLDNYWGLGINSANYEDYLEDNYLYPNGAGRTLVAQRIAEIIGVSDTQTDTE